MPSLCHTTLDPKRTCQMNIFRGDLKRTNAVFVLCALPLLIRLGHEAIVWRLADGPQMVGFRLMHAGAGKWTVLLFASFFAIQIYMLWSAIVAIRSFFPSWRAAASGKRFILVGLGLIWLYLFTGDYLQVDLPKTAIYAGATAMAILLLCMLGLAATSLLRMQVPKTGHD